MNPKVLIIDDDKFQMGDYLRTLSVAKFTPVLISKTASLVPVLMGKQHVDATFFVVDVMMPAGSLYNKEPTTDGAYTGLFISRDLRERFPGVPIILWTAAHKDEILVEARRHALQIANCLYAKKVSMPPRQLVAELEYHIKKGKFRPRILKTLWKVAKFGLHGVSVVADIKELRA